MSTSLSKPVVVVPQVAAVTATAFQLVDVQENYGYTPSDTENGPNNYGRGRHNSVQATIVFDVPGSEPIPRTLTAWEGDEYLAVRGTWTDTTLVARIKEILESE
jgi:hypothetical protein